MKTKVLLLALLAALTSSHAADPAPSHRYQGEVSGVSCASCSKKVKTSLEKLPGVTSVKLTNAGTAGVAKIEIASTSADITKASAIKALGESAADYTIITLEPTKTP